MINKSLARIPRYTGMVLFLLGALAVQAGAQAGLNIIYKYSTEGIFSIFCENTRRCEGLMFNHDGELVGCEVGFGGEPGRVSVWRKS